jgi:hypothetical protein
VPRGLHLSLSNCSCVWEKLAAHALKSTVGHCSMRMIHACTAQWESATCA